MSIKGQPDSCAGETADTCAIAFCHTVQRSGWWNKVVDDVKAATVNSRMGAKQIRQFCPLDNDGRELLKTAMQELGLSSRSHDRILRVARTIADLGGSENIKAEHVGEAIGYRRLDRRLWLK